MTPVVRLRFGASLGLLCAVVIAAGCNDHKPRAEEGKVIPKGRILKGGLPLQPAETASGKFPPGDPGMEIVFIKLGTADAGTEIKARLMEEPPGSFDLIGAEGRGITPGKYRVAIHLGPVGSADQLKGKYSRSQSKITIEVKEGEDVIIDLADYP
jgi:hypothetical protein